MTRRPEATRVPGPLGGRALRVRKWGGIRCRNGRGARTGITLVDVVLVLLILGILAGVAVPIWRPTLHRMQLEAAADRLVWDLRMLQAEAMAQGTNGTANFFVGQDKYVLDLLEDPRTRTTPYEIRLTSMSDLLDLASVTFPQSQLVFFPSGLPSSSGVVMLRTGGWEVEVTVRANGTIERSAAVPASPSVVVAEPVLF